MLLAEGLLPDMTGQPAYVVIACTFLAVAGYVITKVVRRSGDTGEGRKGLEAVDNAAEYLAEQAVKERAGRTAAEEKLGTTEHERDTALSELATARTDLTAAVAARDTAQSALDACEARALLIARSKVTQEQERHRGGPPSSSPS